MVGSAIWKVFAFLNWLPVLADVPTFTAILCLMITFGVIPTVAFNVINVSKVVAIKKMKKKYYSWEECVNLSEVKSLQK